MKATGYNSRASWIAAISCFVIKLLVTLPMRLTGLFFVIIIAAYDTDRESATYPIVTFGVIRTIAGPFVGYLGKIFGTRFVTLIGGILSAIGIGGCFFANNIIGITIFLGGIYGLGLAFGSTLLFVFTKCHFNKNLNFVAGFIISGSTIGSVVMPPLIKYLCHVYGTPGMFLLVGALVLNTVPAAILLNNPKNKERLEFLQFRHAQQRETSGPDYINAIDNFNLEITATLSTNILPTVIDKTSFTNKDSDNGDEGIDLNFQPSIPVKIHSMNFRVLKVETKSEEFSKRKNVELIGFSKTTETEFNSNFVSNSALKELQCGVKYKEADSGVSSATVITKMSGRDKNKVSTNALNLFKDPTFILIMIVQSIHAFVTTLNWTILVDYANDKGIDLSTGLYFVMLLPIGETLGNLCLNWIIDFRYLSRRIFCMLSFMFMGICSTCVIWTYDFPTMLTGLLVFSFFGGAINTTFPGIIFKYIEEEQQSMALASRFMLYAVLCVCKSPIVGYFRGTLGSYDYVYYIIGGLCVLCGLLITLTPVLASMRIRRKAKKELKKSQENSKL